MIVKNICVKVKGSKPNIFGKKYITEKDRADITITSITFNALYGLHRVDRINNPVQVNAIDAIVHITLFDNPICAW